MINKYIKKLKTIGEAKNPFDSTLFHRLSLMYITKNANSTLKK